MNISRELKILAFTKYGSDAASTRQRFIQYGPWLKGGGIILQTSPLLDNNYLRQRLDGGSKNYLIALAGYFRRLKKMLSLGNYDVIWVHCENFPYLPGWVELLVTLTNKPIVFDFDDAIFHQYDQSNNKLVRLTLARKLEPLLQSSSLAICGNKYLEKWARKHCSRTEIVPTVVDINIYGPNSVDAPSSNITIGWIGSPSTWPNLESHIPAFQDLIDTEGGGMRVVGSGMLSGSRPGIDFLPWSEDTEVDLIQGMDIGIMPLSDTPWARGKCGYKLIQYMACALPVVASPVGVNRDIVEHGVNGFLAETEKEWHDALLTLLTDADLRKRMGVAGRRKVEQEYSLQVYGPKVAALLREVASGAGLRTGR